MASPLIQNSLPATCNVVVPTTASIVDSFLSRWSAAGVSLPHAAVAPTTSADIIAVIRYAATNGLKIVPAGGAHGPFVPISSRTISLSMRNFNSIDLDETKADVKIGGGCLAGEVLEDLASKGWYTCIPNSNAVGMAGALLGGMNHPLIGMHGYGADAIKSITIIPFSMPDGSECRELAVSATSEGEEKRLYNVLCGAGHGLGIVTNIVLEAWRTADLGLTDDRIWSRRLIFPPTALDVAARTFMSFFPVPPQLSPAMVLMRAPPTAPKPGAPMIILALNYFGSKDDAERVCARALDQDVTSSAIYAATTMTDLAKINDGFEAINRHGGYKEFHTGFLQEVDEAGIKSSFEVWRIFTENNMQGRASSTVLIGNGAGKVSAGVNRNKFCSARNRGFFVQATPWYGDIAEKEEADTFGEGMLNTLREKDKSEERKKCGFANNLIANQDMSEVYSKEQIKELKILKQIWDQGSLGWSPAVDGW